MPLEFAATRTPMTPPPIFDIVPRRGTPHVHLVGWPLEQNCRLAASAAPCSEYLPSFKSAWQGSLNAHAHRIPDCWSCPSLGRVCPLREQCDHGAAAERC